MTSRQSVILSLLKLTKNGPVTKVILRKEAHVSMHVLEENLNSLCTARLIQLKRKSHIIEVSPRQRPSLAVQAIRLGADFERVCRFLEWKEFESISAQAFQSNGYQVINNFHFKRDGKHWEIDILGLRKPLIVCVDCKHWRHSLSLSAVVKFVDAQVERTKALADALPNYWRKIGSESWNNATLIPLVLSLIPSRFKFHNNVPIVSVLQLQDFIRELCFEAPCLTHFERKWINVERILTDYSK